VAGLVVGALASLRPARAQQPLGAGMGRPGPAAPAGLSEGLAGRVAAVLGADTLDLEDGTRVRLAGVQVPQPARDGRAAWPHATEAAVAVGHATLGRSVRLWHPEDARDRWGRALAHLVRDDGLWLQGALLMEGLARVHTQPRTATGAGLMLDLERTARAARLGIWGERFYRVRNPDETWGDIDSVQVVEGRVVDATVIRGTAYLNFGTDWRRDFTIRAAAEARRAFGRAGIDLGDLSARRVRARGWVFPLNGPMIDLTHPAALEVLEE